MNKKAWLLVVLAFVMSSSIVFADDKTEGKTEKVLYRFSQGALLGTMLWDGQTTVRNINNPLHASYQLCADTACSSLFNEEVSVVFNERGYATKFGIGERNVKGIIITDAAYATGILVASHFLYKKKGILPKMAAIGLNFLQAGFYMSGAIHNNRVRNFEIRNLVPEGAINVRR